MVNKLDNETQIGRLISLVKAHPILYGKSNEDSEDKEKIESLWADVAKKLGSSSRICRRKWYGLMLKFHKREDEGEAAVTEENGKVWPWYEKMLFVRSRVEDIRSVVESIPISETNHVNNLENDASVREVKLQRSSSVVNYNPTANLNGNKLFLESLADDLSSLDLRDQYEFKRKVLELMQSYVMKY